jgi:hypothetical protein
VLLLVVICGGLYSVAVQLAPRPTATTAPRPTATTAASATPRPTATSAGAEVTATTAEPTTLVRLELDRFKELYDDPSTRPLILDVRSIAAYEEEHIAGAISLPEDQVDARAGELPRDEIIIAYCH